MQLFARNNTVAPRVFYFRDAGLGRAPPAPPASHLSSRRSGSPQQGWAGRRWPPRLPSSPRPARGKRHYHVKDEGPPGHRQPSRVAACRQSARWSPARRGKRSLQAGGPEGPRPLPSRRASFYLPPSRAEEAAPSPPQEFNNGGGSTERARGARPRLPGAAGQQAARRGSPLAGGGRGSALPALPRLREAPQPPPPF